MTYHFIINPSACNGRSMKVWRKLERQLKRLGTSYEARMTEKPGDAGRLSRELTNGRGEAGVIVVVGGDGTLNEVLDGLSFGGPVTLGYIPAGFGDNLARSLRIPRRRPVRELKRILNPRSHRQLDYGVVSYGEESEHRRFMISSGIGLNAAVYQDIQTARTKRKSKRFGLGRCGCAFLGIRQFLRARPFKGYIVLDGVQKVEFNHLYLISAYIHPFEGNGFRFAPGADPCDGRLTVRVIHQAARRGLVPIFLGAFRGSRKKYAGSRVYTCQEVEIHTERPMPVHTDGEGCRAQTDIQIRCIPRRIRMIV